MVIIAASCAQVVHQWSMGAFEVIITKEKGLSNDS
jgi:hypothetical protein